MEVDETDPEWSVNIKRGLISLGNLNLRETDTILEDVPASLRDRHLLPNDPLFEEPPPLLYRALETDPVGTCETVYALSERAEGLLVPELNVTKIRNYHSCLQKPILRTGLLATIAAATITEEEVSWIFVYSSNAVFQVEPMGGIHITNHRLSVGEAWVNYKDR